MSDLSDSEVEGTESLVEEVAAEDVPGRGRGSKPRRSVQLAGRQPVQLDEWSLPRILAGFYEKGCAPPAGFLTKSFTSGVFRDVICEGFPERRVELDTYLAIIADLALSYGGGLFYEYHRGFSMFLVLINVWTGPCWIWSWSVAPSLGFARCVAPCAGRSPIQPGFVLTRWRPRWVMTSSQRITEIGYRFLSCR